MNTTLNTQFLAPTFNLKTPKSKRPTTVIFVVRILGKQYRISTKCKVKPSQWNSKRYLADLPNNTLDRYNNEIVNRKIFEFTQRYYNFISYICNNKDTENLEDIFYSCMGAKRKNNYDAIRIFEDADEYYFTNISPVKGSSAKIYDTFRNTFVEFIKPTDRLDQTIINKYEEHLLKLGKSHKTVSNYVSYVVKIINNVVVPRYTQYGFAPVKYVAKRDTRKKDEFGHFALSPEEVQQIKDRTDLSKEEEYTRQWMLLQIKTGLRISDLPKALQTSDDEYIDIETKKTGEIALIVNDDEFKALVKTIIDSGNSVFDQKKYNSNIKNVCSILDRKITQVDVKGNKTERPIHQIITSHCFRYTFVHLMMSNGMTADDVIKLTGHSSTDMIRKVYGVQSIDEKKKSLSKVLPKTINNNTKSSVDTNNLIDQIRQEIRQEFNNLPTRDRPFYIEITDADLRKLEHLKVDIYDINDKNIIQCYNKYREEHPEVITFKDYIVVIIINCLKDDNNDIMWNIIKGIKDDYMLYYMGDMGNNEVRYIRGDKNFIANLREHLK